MPPALHRYGHGCRADRGTALQKQPARTSQPIASASPPGESENWDDNLPEDEASRRDDGDATLESIEDEVILAATARGWKDEANPALVGVVAVCVASAFF
jgi:hypothetical protein